MKIIGRILIISMVFSIFAGLIVTVVNASGANAPGFDGFPQLGSGGVRPEDGQNQPERTGRVRGNSWLLGVIKNVGVIAVLVIAIVWPKSIVRQKKRSSGNLQSKN